MIFHDRSDAGRQLTVQLEHLRGSDGIVLGLPRGGVPVAYEVATRLGLPLEVIVVRKLGVPGHEELAMGAIGEGVRVLDDEVIDALGIRESQVATVERREQAELARRVRAFTTGRQPLQLRGRTAVIADDGIATGSTARAACQVARAAGATRIVLAVPVAPADWQPSGVDEYICVQRRSPFSAIGAWYEDFSQTTDHEVTRLLATWPVRTQERPG